MTLRMEPGRWWQVRNADGKLMLESRNERENRSLARRTKGATLHRVYERHEVMWRRVVPK